MPTVYPDKLNNNEEGDNFCAIIWVHLGNSSLGKKKIKKKSPIMHQQLLFKGFDLWPIIWKYLLNNYTPNKPISHKIKTMDMSRGEM